MTSRSSSRAGSGSAPADFPLTRAVAVCNPMAPPLAPSVVRDFLRGELDCKRGAWTAANREWLAATFKAISSAYQNLGQAYRILQPDFGDPDYRLVYVFQYLTKHCHLVYQMLWLMLPFEAAAAWMESGVDVCSVGGGPGTDIIGVLVYLRSLGSYLGRGLARQRVVGYVLDKDADAWARTWDALRSGNRTLRESQVYCRHIRCDLLGPSLPVEAGESGVRRADLVTLVKSLSAFVALLRDGREIGRSPLAQLLRRVKPGAFVLFIDNKDEAYVNGPRPGVGTVFRRHDLSQNCIFLDHMARPAGLRIIGEWHGMTYTRLCREDHKAMLQYNEEFIGLDRKNPGIRKCAISAFLLQKAG